jgi:FMN phosphatase YigB (HAD superfamily)
MPYAAYLFDVEHIFFDGTAWHRWVHQQARSLGSRVSYESFCHDWRRKWLPQVYGGGVEYWEALESFLRGQQLTECQVQELLIVARSRQRATIQNSRPLPGIQNCLVALRERGKKIAVICNSIQTGEALAQRLAQIGIRVPLDSCLTSRSAGRELPDGLAFSELVALLGVSACETAYVSTSPERLAIAAANGLRTVRIDASCGSEEPAGTSSPSTEMVREVPAPKADFRVARIQDLLGIVERDMSPGVQAGSFAANNVDSRVAF